MIETHFLIMLSLAILLILHLNDVLTMLSVLLQDCEDCRDIFHFFTLGALMGTAFRVLCDHDIKKQQSFSSYWHRLTSVS